MCHQSVGLIQGVIEKGGIPTVSVSILREISEKVVPPRVLFVDAPLGYPLGEPNNPNLQSEIISEALQMLTSEKELPLVILFPSMLL